MLVFSLIILQVLIFGGLFFLIRHLLSRNVTDATAHMQGMIKGYESKGEEVKKKFEEAEKHYQTAMKKSEKEITDLKEQLKEEMDTQKKQILDQAHKESTILILKAKSTCSAMEQEMDHLVKQKAIENAGDLLCQVFTADICKIVHAAWADELIKNGFNHMEWLRVPEEVKVAKVVTAFELTKEQKDSLQKKIDKKLDRKMVLEEELKLDLVAGIIITVGNLVFDGSFTGKMREVVRESSADEG